MSNNNISKAIKRFFMCDMQRSISNLCDKTRYVVAVRDAMTGTRMGYSSERLVYGASLQDAQHYINRNDAINCAVGIESHYRNAVTCEVLAE